MSEARAPKRLALCIGLVILAAEAVHFAIVPLIPAFAERLELSAFECGLVLALPGVSMAISAVPAGSIIDRFGARTVTLVGALLAATAVLQPLMPTLALLLVVRCLCGAAVAFVWAGGSAWVTDCLPPAAASRALARFVAWAATGIAGGPVVAGVLAGPLGLTAPFALATGATLALLAALTRQPGGFADPAARWTGVLPGLKAGASAGLAPAIVVLFAGAFVGSALSVIVPIELDGLGVGEAAIGVLFGSSAGLFALGSGLVSRAAERWATIGVVSLLVLAVALAMTPSLLAASAIGWTSVLFVTSLLRGALTGLAFPLAHTQSDQSVPTSAKMAVLLPIWSLSLVIGPLVAAAAYELAGARVALFAVQLTILVLVGLLYASRRRESSAEARAARSVTGMVEP